MFHPSNRLSCIMKAGCFLFLRNQSNLIVIKEIVPHPVEHHNKAVAESDDAVDVQEDPDHPRDESAE